MKDLFLDQLGFFNLGIDQFGNLVHARFGITIVILTGHQFTKFGRNFIICNARPDRQIPPG